MLPMAGSYGPERRLRQGGLMDPRNYGVVGYGQSSPRNSSLNGQSFQYAQVVEFKELVVFWSMIMAAYPSFLQQKSPGTSSL